MTREHDSDKLLQLAKELDQVMERQERKKVGNKPSPDGNQPDDDAA
jgi:hypothetical protein